MELASNLKNVMGRIFVVMSILSTAAMAIAGEAIENGTIEESKEVTKICGTQVQIIVVAETGSKREEAIAGFQSEGATIRTCQVTQNGKIVIAVIATYPDHNSAVLYIK